MNLRIRIAISGGGLAGATLLHALLPYSHLDVYIFESAPAFKEAGQAIGKLVGEEAEQRRLTKIVHRAAFLKELLANVPEERMHASKKFERAERQADDSVILYFADGSTHHCDVLVGADGIRSVVRRIILGENDPATLPRNSGWWAVWTLQPYQEARHLLGEERTNVDDPREYIWVGDGTFLMHNVLSDGQLVQFVLTGHDEQEVNGSNWHRAVPAETLRKLFRGSLPHIKNAVERLLCQQPEQPAIYLWDHPPAKTFVSGPLCVLGDAAHATTPWLSSGGGMSIEDSLILSTLLGRSKSRAQITAALKAYDEIRRPRTQRIVESSRVMGWLATGQDKEVGLDAEGIGRKMDGFFDFIHDLDIEKHRKEAVELMDRLLEADGSTGD